MEIQGKIIAILPANSGVSKSGNQWTSQEYVLETQGNHKTKMCFSVFGEDRIKQFDIKQGEEVIARFDIDAHEYNGRWYNKISVYNINHVVQNKMQHTPTASVPPSPNLFPTEKPSDGADDLPF